MYLKLFIVQLTSFLVHPRLSESSFKETSNYISLQDGGHHRPPQTDGEVPPHVHSTTRQYHEYELLVQPNSISSTPAHAL